MIIVALVLAVAMAVIILPEPIAALGGSGVMLGAMSSVLLGALKRGKS